MERLSSLGIEVTLRRSRTLRRLSISVNRAGSVRLNTPQFVSDTEAMSFLKSKVDWVIAAVNRQRSKPQVRSFSADEIAELASAARCYLPQRISHLAERCGLPYNRLRLSKARSRWGSCSPSNNISLSIFLMTLPTHLIDFVIIHELCHTIHHDHSKRFHDLVNLHTQQRERSLSLELRHAAKIARE